MPKLLSTTQQNREFHILRRNLRIHNILNPKKTLQTEKTKMKILHIFDTVGIASILCKYLKETYNIETDILTRKCLDRWHITKFYNLAKNVNDKPIHFGLRILKETKNYDIIHNHGWDKIIPFIKILYPKKPIILHYHGTDIRNRWKEKQKFWKKANQIIYSTIDLHSTNTPKRAIQIPNPIDTKIFTPNPNINRQKQTAITMSYYADETSKKLAKQLNLKLTIRQRTLPYSYMPTLLNQYEYYMDIKRDSFTTKNIQPTGEMLCPKNAISCTGLQALACGTKIIKPDGTIIKKLPQHHKPENVIKKIYSIYSLYATDTSND